MVAMARMARLGHGVQFVEFEHDGRRVRGCRPEQAALRVSLYQLALEAERAVGSATCSEGKMWRATAVLTRPACPAALRAGSAVAPRMALPSAAGRAAAPRALLLPARRYCRPAVLCRPALRGRPLGPHPGARLSRAFATEGQPQQPAEESAEAGESGESGESGEAPQAGEAGEVGEGGADEAPGDEPVDELAAVQAELESERAEREAAEEKTAEYKDAMLRALADAENARTIARRDVENARKYGLQKFATDMLDVADNLTRASESVPEALRSLEGKEEPSDSDSALVSLYEGVNMTEASMQSILRRFGIEKVDPLGEAVDPNRHDVKVNLPAGSGDPGTVGLVIRPGYVLDDRVLRAAEVGVVPE